jgi:hypothetical protein
MGERSVSSEGSTPCYEWSVVQSPDPGTFVDLDGIAAVGANDVWAVGHTITASRSTPLVEHWDGASWTVVPSPDAGTGLALYGVAAVSSNDVWAVGYYDFTSVIEHWDGQAWSIVPGPYVGTYGNDLDAIAAISSTNVWAVGKFFNNANVAQTLIEHWNGSNWSIVASPNAGTSNNNLNGIAVVSSSDVWAVGSYGSVMHTLIEHWNGHAWSVVPGPDLVGVLNAVAAVSSTDAWAVGNYSTGGESRTLVEHWDGRAWGVIPSPLAPQSPTLNGVAAASSRKVWAVGYYVDSDAGMTRALMERYGTCLPATSTPTITPTPQPPPCPGERFTDVCPGDYFYTATLALARDDVVSGYNTAPPCNNSLWVPCFKPYSLSTRGQISKVVSLAAGFNDPVTGQTFEDVPPGSTFYTYIERMAKRGIIGGYPCGGSGEPCVPPANRPYFRTNNKVTRGQLSKMVALAFGWNTPQADRDFEDIPPASTFYTYAAQLHDRGIIVGYPCGGIGEGCIPPANLPYFRPTRDVTRGQAAKILQLARTQPTPTPTATATSASAPTASSVISTDTRHR